MVLSRNRDEWGDASNGALLAGPSYFDEVQVGTFLSDLRTNRPARPSGSRPLPGRFATTSATSSPSQAAMDSSSPRRPDVSTLQSGGETSAPERSVSAFSHRRAQSTLVSGTLRGCRPLVREPQPLEQKQDFSTASLKSRDIGSRASIATSYAERGDRWMEKQEAKSLRIALEDMDLLEEQEIHNAAQDEATELIKQHQNPKTKPDVFAPYNYRAYLRKGSYASPTSVTRCGSIAAGAGVGVAGIESTSEGSTLKHNEQTTSQKSQHVPQMGQTVLQLSDVASQSSYSAFQDCHDDSNSGHNGSQADLRESQSERQFSNLSTRPKFKNFGFPLARSKASGRRRSSGPLLSNGGADSGPFQNPNDNIYEELEALPDIANVSLNAECVPKPLMIKSRNVSGGQAPIQDPAVSKQFSRHEIHKNPPSQSRDPSYTRYTKRSNAMSPQEDTDVPKKRNGLEIRSDEIRAATSLKMKDRSPKLPTPSMVSNRPGRPIISFDPNYKAEQERPKQEQSTHEILNSQDVAKPLPNKPTMPASTMSMPVIPTINLPEPLTVQIAGIHSVKTLDLPIPRISNPPGIGIGENLAINVLDSSVIPSIKVSESPSISISEPTIPATLVPDTRILIRPLPPASPSSTKPASTGSSRPLPHHSSTNPLPLPRSHWTPTSPRATAQCSACALSIAGRVVSAASQRFHPACFSCFICGDLLECVAFYPEPENFRSTRLARIEARLNSLPLPEADAYSSEQGDGDDGLRFYCHLDYHEKFSPRCRNCRTPIEGEVVVACGGEWHVGHFFCAECGDPFDSNTPFVEKNGYAWCVSCHSRRFNGKCAGCRKVIEEVVVKALGREWHEACFCCKACGGGFDDGRFFTRENREDPVCVRCEELRLKA